MTCSEIPNLVLDQKSYQGLEEIRRKMAIATSLTWVLNGSVLLTIFVDQGGLGSPLGTAYQISQFEWKVWRDAMMSVKPILRGEIRTIAVLQKQDHSDQKQKLFWAQIAQGCE